MKIHNVWRQESCVLDTSAYKPPFSVSLLQLQRVGRVYHRLRSLQGMMNNDVNSACRRQEWKVIASLRGWSWGHAIEAYYAPWYEKNTALRALRYDFYWHTSFKWLIVADELRLARSAVDQLQHEKQSSQTCVNSFPSYFQWSIHTGARASVRTASNWATMSSWHSHCILLDILPVRGFIPRALYNSNGAVEMFLLNFFTSLTNTCTDRPRIHLVMCFFGVYTFD